MLLQLKHAHKEDVNKLIEYEDEHNYVLPGKLLTNQQFQQLIDTSRGSGIIQ